MRSHADHPRRLASQRGSAALELALVSLVAFVPLLFGIVQMGLVFFTVNFATEATRYVARTAVVCDKTEAQQERIKAHIKALFPLIFRDGSEIQISYNDPAACINPDSPASRYRSGLEFGCQTSSPSGLRLDAAHVAHDADPGELRERYLGQSQPGLRVSP